MAPVFITRAILLSLFQRYLSYFFASLEYNQPNTNFPQIIIAKPK